MLSDHKIVRLQASLILAIIILVGGGITLTQPISASDPAIAVTMTDEAMVDDYIAESESMMADQNCLDYAFELAHVDDLTSTVMYHEVVETSDESLIDGYVAECQAMTDGTIEDCTLYAIDLAKFGGE